MDYFITCHFNYCNYESRNRLTKEFNKRYPDVWILEVAYSNEPFKFDYAKNWKGYRFEKFKGWATNEVMNLFIEEVGSDNINSLTFIDADVILYDTFFDLVREKMKEYAELELFIQPYSEMRFEGNELNYLSCLNYVKKFSKYSDRAHTGLVYSYSGKLIKKIGKFPTCMVLGGFDTILYLSLLKRYEINNFTFISNEIEEFFNKMDKVHFLCLDGVISTEYHGKPENRQYTSRIQLYRNLNDKVIEDYFYSRKEDL